MQCSLGTSHFACYVPSSQRAKWIRLHAVNELLHGDRTSSSWDKVDNSGLISSDFEYTTYAIRRANKKSVLRSGRRGRSCSRSAKSPAQHSSPSRDFYVFESISGDASILRDNDACRGPAAAMSKNLAGSVNARALKKKERSTKQLLHESELPATAAEDSCITSSTTTDHSSAAAFQQPHSEPQCLRTPAEVVSERIYSSDLQQLSAYLRTSQMKTPELSLRPHPSASRQHLWDKLQMTQVYNTQSEGSLEPSVGSHETSVGSQGQLIIAALCPQQSYVPVRKEIGHSLDDEGITEVPKWLHTSRRLAQRRLAIGSHALGLRSSQAASLPKLRSTLESLEPSLARRRIRNLQRALGNLSFKAAVGLVIAEPRILLLDELQLEICVLNLAAFVVFCPPSLFNCKKAGSRAAFQQLSDLPSTPDELAAASNSASLQVFSLVTRLPRLLTFQADICKVTFALMQLLQCNQGTVASMLYRRPLLMTNHHERPQRGRDVPPTGGGSFFSNPVPSQSFKTKISETSECKEPINHNFYFESFGLSLQQLQSLLEMDRPQVVSLVSREPGLLTIGPGRLAAAAAALSRPFDLDPVFLGELVDHSPELLCRSPGHLSAMCSHLHSLLMDSSVWAHVLPRLMKQPRSLALALKSYAARHRRLDYLIRTGRDRGISFKEAILMQDVDFNDMYPGFRAWNKAK